MNAHDQLSWIENFKLQTLIYQVILSNDIKAFKVAVLLKLVQTDLLFSELLLHVP